MEVVIAHGGGAALTDWLTRVDKQPMFVNGLRVTDDETLELAVMVFAGAVNKQLVALLNAADIPAVGISGVDGGLVRARRQTDPDIGLVGQAEHVDTTPLRALLDHGLIPVVACIVLGPDGQILNINADTLAGDLARALCASRVVFLTDVPGVRGADGSVIPTLSAGKTDRLIAEGCHHGRHDPQGRGLSALPRWRARSGHPRRQRLSRPPRPRARLRHRRHRLPQPPLHRLAGIPRSAANLVWYTPTLAHTIAPVRPTAG